MYGYIHWWSDIRPTAFHFICHVYWMMLFNLLKKQQHYSVKSNYVCHWHCYQNKQRNKSKILIKWQITNTGKMQWSDSHVSKTTDERFKTKDTKILCTCTIGMANTVAVGNTSVPSGNKCLKKHPSQSRLGKHLLWSIHILTVREGPLWNWL